ncbi:MAG: HAMP domain-containing sensor histidine kinase [Bacillota bacterium]|nr:HAMP domain-containing sensor histidine kinase [Bacillota bacterium]
MSKWISRSLSAQLFCGVVTSLLAAGIVFGAVLALGGQLLDHTVYGRPFASRMADQQFEKLQNYVTEEAISLDNLHRLNAWCSRGDKVYLTLYQRGSILYESPLSGDTESKPDPEQFDPEQENPEQEYALTLHDGATVQAFLYYYAGDIFYFWMSALAGGLAFLTFSLCFVSLVHRKLSYVKQLKQELDILAGGDLSYAVSVRGEDELSELASGIDQMRRSILAHQTAEEEMRSANSQLVTAMSHDLRTPLTSLLAYLELMDRGKYDSEEQLRHFIRRSLDKTLCIKAMADKLFEYFLVYCSEWEEPNLEDADGDELFRQFWGEYVFSLESKGFRVTTDFGMLNGRIPINLDLIRRAFDNLYSNLLKYADPDRHVEISFRREKDRAVLTLVNGVSPRRDACESTNIGLNTCHRILQYHNGSFETAEEAGVFRVTVSLPLSEKPSTSPT